MADLSTPIPSKFGYFSVIGKSAAIYLIGKDDFVEPVAVGDELLDSNLPVASLSYSISKKHQGLIDKASKQAAESPDVWKCIEIRPLKLAFRFYYPPNGAPIRIDHLPANDGETLDYFFMRKDKGTEFEDQLVLSIKWDPLFKEPKAQVTKKPIKLYTLYPEGIFNDPE